VPITRKWTSARYPEPLIPATPGMFCTTLIAPGVSLGKNPHISTGTVVVPMRPAVTPLAPPSSPITSRAEGYSPPKPRTKAISVSFSFLYLSPHNYPYFVLTTLLTAPENYELCLGYVSRVYLTVTVGITRVIGHFRFFRLSRKYLHLHPGNIGGIDYEYRG